MVSFRWRQAPFAQEQMHAGLHAPDRTRSPGGVEAAVVGRELAGIDLPGTGRAPVALVFDYEAAWITAIQPQGRDFRYVELAYRWYEAVRRFGLDVDMVPAGAPLRGYAAAVVPCLPHVSDAASRAFGEYEGVLLFDPRGGSKTRHFGIPEELPPGPLWELLPIRVTQVASLRPGLSVAVEGPFARGAAVRWREHVEGSLEPLAGFADGGGVFGKAGGVLSRLLAGRGIAAHGARRDPGRPRGPAARGPAGRGADARPRRPALRLNHNHGDTPWAAPVPDDATFLLGGRDVPPQGPACWRA